MTTFDPGARLVFTQGFTRSPRATAFRASRPAPSMTAGFDVFVQLVMAAITTAPWPIVAVPPRTSTGIVFAGSTLPVKYSPRAFCQDVFICASGTRSCGRFGPARLGTTLPRSSSSVSVNSGSALSAVRKSPCAL